VSDVRRTYLFWIALSGAVGLSLWKADVRMNDLFAPDARSQMAAMVRSMFPPELAPSFLRSMITPTAETLQISVMGMAVAIAIGFPLSLLATATITWSGILHERYSSSSRGVGFVPYAVARSFLSILRSIPEVVWGLMFVRAVGLGPFAGVLAIGVAYGGMLGKVYSEILEGVNLRPAETLQASGASRLAVVTYGMLPAALPALASYTLYRWECAIRASAILGFVGAGGLGQQIELSLRMFNFHEVATLLLILWGFVFAVETLSAMVRRSLAR